MLPSRVRRLAPILVFALTAGAVGAKGYVYPAVVAAEQAPTFSLKLLSGGDLSSETFKGQVLIIRFLASW